MPTPLRYSSVVQSEDPVAWDDPNDPTWDHMGLRQVKDIISLP